MHLYSLRLLYLTGKAKTRRYLNLNNAQTPCLFAAISPMLWSKKLRSANRVMRQSVSASCPSGLYDDQGVHNRNAIGTGHDWIQIHGLDAAMGLSHPLPQRHCAVRQCLQVDR